MYIQRLIDKPLWEWARRKDHKPLLLRGARQVGKSTAVQHLGQQFEHYVEVNFEKHPQLRTLFTPDLDVKRIVSQMAAMVGQAIIPGKTLLFLDEVQTCPEAIMALRFFKEDLPSLHVVAAGSLLEFTLNQIPTFGVGRIHSMYMFPLTFDEFLQALGEDLLIQERNAATAQTPLAEALHTKLTALLRTFILVGGMPETVATWVEHKDYIQCQEVLDDILTGYESDFPKYKKRVDPQLLRLTLRSCAVQAGNKFVYSAVGGGYKISQVKTALELLTQAGLIIPVTHTSANGIPLGAQADPGIQKMLLLDTGILLRLLNIHNPNSTQTSRDILTLSDTELVNKGPLAEMLFGLEYLHHRSPHLKHDLYYWVRQHRNAMAEVDYVTTQENTLLPIEVKAARQGGMKSLWAYMAEKNLTHALRCSLENFGELHYTDPQHITRHLKILPLYAISML